MTKQENIGTSRHRSMRLNILASCMIAIGFLIAEITSVSEDSVNAQVMGDHRSSENMTSNLKELKQKVMSNGTINLEQAIFNAISSKINFSLIEGMSTAQRSVANNSFALAGFGGEYGGYFAYQILLGTPEMKYYNVLVDPGNGQILATQEVSRADLEKMHKEHSAEVVNSSYSGGIGFPFLIPH